MPDLRDSEGGHRSHNGNHCRFLFHSLSAMSRTERSRRWTRAAHPNVRKAVAVTANNVKKSWRDRKSDVTGKSVSVGDDQGGRRNIEKKRQQAAELHNSRSSLSKSTLT